MRPFIVKDQAYLVPRKSVFNKIIGDSQLELEFADFLEQCPDVISYAKNYMGINFKLDYVNADGDISNYMPDFFVRSTDGKTYVIEIKGNADLDVPSKMARLIEWIKDINAIKQKNFFDYIYVPQDEFEKYANDMKTFEQLTKTCREYKG